jgi:hypothetical protein
VKATGKGKGVNIRIGEKDLTDLKVRAREEGLPYQTPRFERPSKVSCRQARRALLKSILSLAVGRGRTDNPVVG